jgi:hypothetical protein
MEDKNTSISDAEGDCRLSPLLRTRGPATVVYIFLIAGTVLSALLFTFQLRYEVEPGVLFIEEPGGAVHVWGHAFRAAIGFVLAVSLHRYLAGLRAIRRKEHGADARVFASIATWWKSVAASALLCIAYGLWAVIALRQTPTIYRATEEFTMSDPSGVSIEFRLAEVEAGEDLQEATNPQTGQSIWLHPTAVITNADIAKIAAVAEPGSSPAMHVTFTAAGNAAIRAATRQHLDRPMAILIDGIVVSAPIVQWEIEEAAIISGIGTMEEIEQIVSSMSGQKGSSE